MPVYTVKDKETGKTIKFNWTGEGLPGEQDFQQVFQQARDFAPGPSGDVGKDAQTFASGMGAEAKQLGEGLVQRVGNVLGFHPSQGDYIPEGLNPMVGAYNATKQDLGGLPDFIRREVDLAKNTFMKGDPESGGRLTTQALAALLGGRVLGKTGVGQAAGEAGAVPFRAVVGRIPRVAGAATAGAEALPGGGVPRRVLTAVADEWKAGAPKKGLPPPPSTANKPPTPIELPTNTSPTGYSISVPSRPGSPQPGMPQSSASGPVSAAPESVGPPIDLPVQPPPPVGKPQPAGPTTSSPGGPPIDIPLPPAAARRPGPAGPPNSASGPVSAPPPGEAPPIDLNIEGGASAAPPQALPPPPKLGPQPPQARVQYWFQRALKQYPGAPPAKLMEGAVQMALDEIKQGEAAAAGMGTGFEGLPTKRGGGKISSAPPSGIPTGAPGGEVIGTTRGSWQSQMKPKGPFGELGDPVITPNGEQLQPTAQQYPHKIGPRYDAPETIVTPEEMAKARLDLEILTKELQAQNPGWSEGVQGPGLPWDPKILLREE